MEVGLVKKVDIDTEMQQSYLDFAMSVIVARALPDARDGLKPVQRRILYAMYDMGLRPETPYKKSARIVGEVLGKYHPHGDMAVYEAMARLAQDFSMRYPLVDGQGNFGSVDGDPPAAMRYTEARLQPFAIDLLSQIERDTVNFTSNFDESLTEPEVLPSALPNLLVNGSTGIAVGMATSIPPHNLGEVVDALHHMLERWDHLDDVSIADLMAFVQGPDFPTGGIIIQDATTDLQTAYGAGRGRVLVRGRVHMEDTGRGRSRLIITELPYMTNKASLIERIAELVRESGLEGIADLRDESDRQGMRVVIELNKTSEPEAVLRELYRRTPLESTFGINLLALVDGEPRLLSLKQALKVYIEHRLTVVRRRSEFDLGKARQRAHFLEGLRIAIAHLDEVIQIIRGAPDVDTARARLIKRFKLSDIQAQAILDMPLRRLAALERRKIEEEYKEVIQTIKTLEALLKSPKKMRDVVRDELLAMKQQYGDRRRTQIVSLREGESARTLLTTTDLTPAQQVWVGITPDGWIARTGGDALPQGSGRQAPRWMVRANTHHTLYLVTEQGQAAAVAVHALPEAERPAEGIPFWKISPLAEDDLLASIFTMPAKLDEATERYILTVSAQGLVKKSAVGELPGPSSQRFTLVKINPEDRLVGASFTDGQVEALLATERGMAIRFSEAEVRPMGLVAAGVNGIKLSPADRVVAFSPVSAGLDVLFLASDGAGWRMPLSEFPLQGRYGQGVIACKLPARAWLAGLLVGKPEQAGYAWLEKSGAQPVRVGAVPAGKRALAGKGVINVKGDVVEQVTSAWDCLSYWDPDAAPKPPEPLAKKTHAPSANGDGRALKSAPEKPAAGKATAEKANGKPALKAAGKTAPGDKASVSKAKAVETVKSSKTAKETGVKAVARVVKAGAAQAAKKTGAVNPKAETPPAVTSAKKPARGKTTAETPPVEKKSTRGNKASAPAPSAPEAAEKKTARAKTVPPITGESKPAAVKKTAVRATEPVPEVGSVKKPAAEKQPPAVQAELPLPANVEKRPRSGKGKASTS